MSVWWEEGLGGGGGDDKGPGDDWARLCQQESVIEREREGEGC